eukprot:CAMPEP_0183327114 /NCGR_PEP_ID=MMETSP0160_2-20130417/83594_1 /TAXON_ID=2839 ORGANISM="Odontella Sinensis, Strain Grunow 1884" /NCGR_SAMPLE_ID=MMETSP0160_2 /ASSEMBLY_ACC=CAM_ASM_000250 /LENGTH=520 /DNA_ID=CAMNT_0025495227 /DNA_START=291 /DNA_END=1849 /DNA_ORIENTATION=-
MSSDSILKDCDEASNATDDALANTIAALRTAKKRLKDGIGNLKKKRRELAEENGYEAEFGKDEVMEINAGGQIIVVKRGILTQCEGSILEALFSGRWENKLLRDLKGRVFLDVDPDCFKKIVEFLCDRQDASLNEELVVTQCVDEEDRPYFNALVSALGLDDVLELSVEQNEAANDPEEWETLTFDETSGRLKAALETEKEALSKAKEWLTHNEALFQKENEKINFFLQDNNGIVQLSVKGTIMTTKRSTLGFWKDTPLAKQFNDPKWAVKGTIMTTKRSTLGFWKDTPLAKQFNDPKWASENETNPQQDVKSWDSDQVYDWATKIEGLPKSVSQCLSSNKVNGIQLLAMEREDFKDIDVNNTGFLAVLMANKKRLQRSMDCEVVFIEQNRYCFGKIVNQLRIQAMCPSAKHLLSIADIQASQQKSFQRTLDYYFPGESASSIFVPNDSNILSLQEHSQVLSWLKEDNLPYRSKLLYRASHDGWGSNIFHEKCDNRGATLTVVQSTGGYVFGGYADESWS